MYWWYNYSIPSPPLVGFCSTTMYIVTHQIRFLVGLAHSIDVILITHSFPSPRAKKRKKKPSSMARVKKPFYRQHGTAVARSLGRFPTPTDQVEIAATNESAPAFSVGRPSGAQLSKRNTPLANSHSEWGCPSPRAAALEPRTTEHSIHHPTKCKAIVNGIDSG